MGLLGKGKNESGVAEALELWSGKEIRNYAEAVKHQIYPHKVVKF